MAKSKCSFRVLSMATAVLILTVVNGQLPEIVKTTLANCVKVAGYKYCNKNNESSVAD